MARVTQMWKCESCGDRICHLTTICQTGSEYSTRAPRCTNDGTDFCDWELVLEVR